MITKYFDGYDAFSKWLDNAIILEQDIDNIICVVMGNGKISVDASITCKRTKTAVDRFFKGLEKIPEIQEWKDTIKESIAWKLYKNNDTTNHDWSWGIEWQNENLCYIFLNTFLEPEKEKTIRERLF